MDHEHEGRAAARKLQPIIEQLAGCKALWERVLVELAEKCASAIAQHGAVDLAESSKIARAVEDLEALRAGAAVAIARLKKLAT